MGLCLAGYFARGGGGGHCGGLVSEVDRRGGRCGRGREMKGAEESSFLTSNNLIPSVSAKQHIIGHLLLLRVQRTVVIVLRLLLDIAVSAKDGTFAVGLGGGIIIIVAVKLGVGGVVVVIVIVCDGSGSRCFGTLLGTLGGRGVGIFGLPRGALALWGRGSDVGGSVVVGSVAVGVGVGWTGRFLGATFLGRLGAGSHFGVGITAFGIGRLDLDGLATLLGSGFRRGGIVVIVGVSVGDGFTLGFLGSTVGCVGDACAAHELLLDDEEAGAG